MEIASGFDNNSKMGHKDSSGLNSSSLGLWSSSSLRGAWPTHDPQAVDHRQWFLAFDAHRDQTLWCRRRDLHIQIFGFEMYNHGNCQRERDHEDRQHYSKITPCRNCWERRRKHFGADCVLPSGNKLRPCSHLARLSRTTRTLQGICSLHFPLMMPIQKPEDKMLWLLPFSVAETCSFSFFPQTLIIPLPVLTWTQFWDNILEKYFTYAFTVFLFHEETNMQHCFIWLHI